MLKQLIWKQWHEQGWRVAFATVILCGFTGIGLWTRIVPDSYVLMIAAGLGVTLLPIFQTMGLIAPSRADRSFESLMSLPLETRRLFRLVVCTGMVGTWVPIVAAAALALFMVGGREVQANSIAGAAIEAIVLASLMALWTLCLSVRQRHESGVGLTGLVVVVGLVALDLLFVGMTRQGEPVAHWLWMFHPLSLIATVHFFGTEDESLLWGWTTLTIQAGMAYCVYRWALQRFPRPTKERA